MSTEGNKLFSLCDEYELYNSLQFPYNVWIIDIESEDQYAQSHIMTSINIPFASNLSDDDIIDILDANLCKYRDIHKVYIYSNDICNASVWLYFLRLKKLIFTSCIHKEVTKNEFYVLTINYDEFNTEFPFLCTKSDVSSVYDSVLDITDDIWNDHFGDTATGSRGNEIDAYISHPNVIINNKIYLGDIDHAYNKETLCNLGITHIVNCTARFDNKYEHNNDMNIAYAKVSVNDTTDENISQYFEHVIDFIDNALQNDGNKVLIHCFAGISRSSTVMIAYIMQKMKLGYDDARSFVKEKRNVIDPNLSFVKQLKKYEKRLFLNN